MSPKQRHQSSGQTLPLFAVMAPALLALMALGIDGAQLFLERRDAQSAADLAALAGVRSLPGDADLAKADAKVIGVAHGFGQNDVVPVTPYQSDDSAIEVTVNSEVSTFFMSILSVFVPDDYASVDVSARAVATQETTAGTPGGPGYAMFSLEDNCSASDADKSIDWSGSNSIVNGHVHADTSIDMGGSDNNVIGPTTYVCEIEPGSNSFTPAPVQQDADPPVSHTYADYAYGSGQCDYLGPTDDAWDVKPGEPAYLPGGGSITLTLNLPSGVYCTRASGDKAQIVVPDQNTNGNVTFVAGYGVDISASNVTFTPYVDNILIFSNGNDDKAVQWQGSSGDMEGLIYAPRGYVDYSGSSNNTLMGGIVADRIKWSGSGLTLDGDIGASVASDPVQVIALVE